MIVRMKHLDLVCMAADRKDTLERLRELGAVHLDLAGACGIKFTAEKEELARAEKALRLILKARTDSNDDSGLVRPREIDDILTLADDRARLEEALEALRRDIAKYEPYGDFDPALAQKLLDKGVDIDDILPSPLPEMRLSKMREKASRIANRILIDNAKLSQSDEKMILARYPALSDRIAFAAAEEAMKSHGAVAFVSGWVPESAVGLLRAAAKDSAWGLLLRDALPEEIPPTLVKPPKFFAPVKSLFDGLGIAPAYTEADVSVPFMCYFSLFFAMLVGDGAYGAIFFAAVMWGWKKYRARPGNAILRSWLVMLTVFSAATVLWGVLSNTWFGAAIPWLADLPTVRWLADPSYRNMMLLCFTIGVSHLMLARIWNGLCRLNDTSCLSEFGWAGILLFMYFVTNSIVGIFSSIPGAMYWVFGLSLVAVFGFTVKPSELKTRGAELGMLPLNIMSALGDIISYVRLFAVGLASVKVAENFNAMATGLVAGAEDWWVRALMSVAMVLILVVGHALNLAMAALSVLVHAVRLNTLEFSNHKGVTWSGYAFKPFKKSKE